MVMFQPSVDRRLNDLIVLVSNASKSTRAQVSIVVPRLTANHFLEKLTANVATDRGRKIAMNSLDLVAKAAKKGKRVQPRP
jgi:hypothetical protein